MVNIREVRNENYIGFIIPNASVSHTALQMVQKGKVDGLIKGYCVKYNGNTKVLFDVNQYQNYYMSINRLPFEDFFDIFISIIDFFHNIVQNSFFSCECIVFNLQDIYFDTNNQIKLMSYPIITENDPNTKYAFESNVKYVLQQVLYSSSFINYEVCRSIYDDLQNANLSMEDIWGLKNKGKYGAKYQKNQSDELMIDACYQLVSVDNLFPPYLLKKDKIVIGKTKEKTDLALSIQGISREHCEIIKNQHKLFIRDLNSTNGTFLNGVRIFSDQYMPLHENDRIVLSNIAFEIRKFTL